MNKLKLNSIFKNTFLAFSLCVILFLTAFIISNLLTYAFKDILFIEGMILTILSALSFTEADPADSSYRTLSQFNQQFISESTLEVPHRENDTELIEKEPTNKFTMVALLISGLICLVFNFVI